MSTPGSNGPAILNASGNTYDREIPYDAPVGFDTGLFVDAGQKTLLALREELMIRLGYAAMLASPPPGMKEELNSYLQDAQEQLYWRYETLRTERWWAWQTSAGERFYDVPIDGLSALNFRKITWAGISDNGAWNTLRQGINTLDFTSVSQGYPTHYDLREYLELWPAPDKAYVVWLKGHMGLSKFTEDTDRPTIDNHIVFLFALANAKNHRGQPDAQAYAQSAERMLREYVAGSHGTRRYFPRPSTQGLKGGAWGADDCGPWTMPRATWRS